MEGTETGTQSRNALKLCRSAIAQSPLSDAVRRGAKKGDEKQHGDTHWQVASKSFVSPLTAGTA